MEKNVFQPIKLIVYDLKQDDPKKCTSKKLIRFGLAIPISRLRQIPRTAIVLNPFSNVMLLSTDDQLAEKSGVVVIDCSWRRVKETFSFRLRGKNRRLPKLIAANPAHYGRHFKLSSLEALAAALYIMGRKDQAWKIVSIYKWGNVFLELNKFLLEDYRQAKNIQDTDLRRSTQI